MNEKELKIYLERYTNYKKDLSDVENSRVYFNAREYHELNCVESKVLDVIETIFDFDKNIENVIDTLKIFNIYEE